MSRYWPHSDPALPGPRGSGPTPAVLCRVPMCCEAWRAHGEVSDHECVPRPVEGPGVVCGTCSRRVTRWIASLPAMYAELERSLTLSGRPGERTSGGDSEARIPINTAVAGHRYEIRSWLLAEARAWRALLGLVSWPRDTVPGMAAWLVAHAPRMAGHARLVESPTRRGTGDAVGVHEQLRALRSRGGALMDLPRDRARHPVGPCPEKGCHGEVWAFIGRDQADSAMACDVCGRGAADSTQFLRASRRILATIDARQQQTARGAPR